MKSEFQKKIEKLEKLRAEVILLANLNRSFTNFKEDLEAFKVHVEKSRIIYQGIQFDS